MRRLAVGLALVVAVALFTGCDPSESGSAGGHHKNHGQSQKSEPDHTPAQGQAISAAKNYLALGSGFSQAGLIDQLTSKAGNGFKRPDAVFAVNHVNADWNKQAVLAAKGYMDLGSGFSRAGLIQQLTSPAGNKFTQAQAEYAADHVGL